MSGLEAVFAAAAGLQAIGTIAGGMQDASALEAQAQAAGHQAKLTKQQAGQERASAQRAAIEERKRAGLLISRGRAVAGASGFGVTDPSVINTLADVAAAGEYNALAVLSTGEERARGLESQGSLLRYEQDQYRDAATFTRGAAYLNAFSSILSSAGGATMFERYAEGLEPPPAGGAGADSYSGPWGPWGPWYR